MGTENGGKGNQYENEEEGDEDKDSLKSPFGDDEEVSYGFKTLVSAS